MSRPEILAPAGNREMLGAAVFSGADAVYLGLTGFNARRTAGNFTPMNCGRLWPSAMRAASRSMSR